MAMTEAQVVLRSKSDIDFEFVAKNDHIIASYLTTSSSKIPGGSYLYSINGHQLHGSSSASLLKDVNQTIESEKSYPLTLVFKSELDVKVRKKMNFPVSNKFLGEFPPLSEKEWDEYKSLAKSWVQPLIDASNSDEGFDYVCTRENVEIYQGHDPHKKIQMVRGKTKVKCSKDEMRAFMISPTTDSFRRLFHMIDAHFQDGILVHKCPKDYKHPEVPFYSIKWAVMGVRSSPFWLRDVCWLEYGDILKDENGEEFGFGVASSIERPTECPTMEEYKLVRADVMVSGYLFRPVPNAPDYMEITYVVQADPKGWLPAWAVNMFAWQQALNVARIRHNAEGIHQAKEKMADHTRNGAAVQGVLVPHGQSYAIDIDSPEGSSILSFGFCTEDHDIGFYVTKLNSDISWSESTRYSADKSPISGQVKLSKKCHQIIFDNTYSWFTAKQVYYWFSVSS
ncbi:uncharacterized protein LOC110239123 [Exaiptasia diaphana]|uniref:START domain-containing protein n=1 Tax=Exaiptasia diaphana TaxID=2652724 RepID=A0A913X857_EXADI|nr:uncharacterized protein LOC110239123 [Exaiptasia diaphana]KXJ14256.1 hypothetical protein AC249_AIPGENE13338 [Exaiptasia diaphana]